MLISRVPLLLLLPLQEEMVKLDTVDEDDENGGDVCINWNKNIVIYIPVDESSIPLAV